MGVVLFGQPILADGASINVLPVSGEKAAGSVFTADINLEPAGNKVCVVSGTVLFDNLACQNISLGSDQKITAQTSPTCANPNFTIGIKTCTTTALKLFSVSVKAPSSGAGQLMLTGVKAISISGTSAIDVPLAAQSGNYTIAQPLPKEPEVPAEQPSQENPAQGPAINVTEPEQTETEIIGTETQETAETFIPREAGAASLADTMAKFFNTPVFIIIAIFVILLFALWLFGKFPFKKKDQQQ